MRWSLQTPIILIVGGILTLLIWTEFTTTVPAQSKAARLLQATTTPELENNLTQALRLGFQSTQTFDDTYWGLTRSTLLATESLRRYPTVEGNIALRHGLSLLSRPNTQRHLEVRNNIGAFSSDLQRIVTGGGGGTHVWDVTTGQLLTEISDTNHSRAITFSTSGKWVAAGGADKIVRIWDANTGQELLTINHDDIVNAIAFSSDDKWVATGSFDNMAYIWDTTTGKKVAQLSHEGWLLSVAFSPDDQWLATGSSDNQARIWDISTGEAVKQFGGPVEFVGFSSGTERLVTVNSQTIQIWQIESGSIIARMQAKDIKLAAISPNGQWIATGDQDGVFKIWEVATGKEISRMSQLGSSSSVTLRFSFDNQQLGTGNFYGPIATWQVEHKSPSLILASSSYTYVNRVLFSPDSHLLGAELRDNSVHLWTVKDRQEVAILQHQNQLNDFAFSPDSQWLATASDDNTAQLLEVDTPNQPVELPHDGPVQRVVFSNDGQWLATASHDGTARIWDVNKGEELIRVEHDTIINRDGSAKKAAVNSVTFSPDDKTIATGSNDSTARIWDTKTGDELARFNHPPLVAEFITYTWLIDDVTFALNGQWLIANSYFIYATGSNEQIKVWDITTQQEISDTAIITSNLIGRQSYFTPQILLAHKLYKKQTVKRSPHGKFFVIGTGSTRYNTGDAAIWDAFTGEQITKLPHPGQVLQVAFSPDSHWVATRSTGNIGPNYEGGGVRLWDTEAGREIIYDKNGQDMAFSSDGRWLAVGNKDGSVNLLYLQPDDLIDEACTRLLRNLTRRAWRQYVGDEPYQPTCPNLPLPEN